MSRREKVIYVGLWCCVICMSCDVLCLTTHNTAQRTTQQHTTTQHIYNTQQHNNIIRLIKKRTWEVSTCPLLMKFTITILIALSAPGCNGAVVNKKTGMPSFEDQVSELYLYEFVASLDGCGSNCRFERSEIVVTSTGMVLWQLFSVISQDFWHYVVVCRGFVTCFRWNKPQELLQPQSRQSKPHLRTLARSQEALTLYLKRKLIATGLPKKHATTRTMAQCRVQQTPMEAAPVKKAKWNAVQLATGIQVLHYFMLQCRDPRNMLWR